MYEERESVREREREICTSCHMHFVGRSRVESLPRNHHEIQRCKKNRRTQHTTTNTSIDATPNSRVEYYAAQQAHINDQIIEAILVQASDGLHAFDELHADLEVADTI